MPQAASSSSQGFLKALFDFKFSTLVTTKVVRVLYIIITILYSLGAIALFIELISKGGSDVAVAIIVVPLGYLLYLTFARIVLELIIVVFRIGEDVRIIRDARTEPGADLSQTLAELASEQTSQSSSYPPGWYDDPSGAARARYWDGRGWTVHTRD